MELSGKRVIVVGLGKSGIAAARLCQTLGANVVGTDAQPLGALSAEVRALGIELVVGGHAGVAFKSANLIVVSPGVPPLAELGQALRAGVEVIGELELASRLLAQKAGDRPIIAVGGTNGKSTTTTLVGQLFEAANLKVFVGGNLGTPVSDACAGDYQAYVLEVSSFQLERAPSFCPTVAVLLNVTDDHLDRYASFDEYLRAKGNAFVNQTPEHVAVVPKGDELCETQARRGRGRIVTFGRDGDYFVDARSVVEKASGERVSLERAELYGAHNLQNAAAAFAAARTSQLSMPAISAGFERFRPLPHRMALVRELCGVRFYDDSKATNVGAAVTALLGLAETHAVLIAGGRDKLGSYAPLQRALEHKGRAVVVIGEAAERIAAQISGHLPLEHAASIDEAVERAYRLAKPGDAVLLSPACASFDMFKSYAERGERFALAVARLAKGPHAGART